MVEIESKPRQYIVSPPTGVQALSLLPQGVQPLTLTTLQEILDKNPNITVHRSIETPGLGLLSAGPEASAGVIVASMPAREAEIFAQSAQVTIEEDHTLELAEPSPGLPMLAENPSELIPFSASTTHQVRAVNNNGAGVEEATTFIYSQAHYATGITDSSGSVTITLRSPSNATPTAIYVNPKSGYWGRWIDQPALDPNNVNTVTLKDLPNNDEYGWGQIAMGLNKLPSEYRGAGIKIAVIDSGAAALTHPDLGNIRNGKDLTEYPPTEQWTNDTVAHGSHCAGIISGSTDARGVRGFAPDAELHILKIFPGGHFSDLIEAINYCINNSIDVINMSLGGPEVSAEVTRALSLARQNGIVCVAAAGNSGGKVQFPGTSPDVLTVGAVGLLGTFPEDSYHARQVGLLTSNQPGSPSYFTAKFSCHGPEVDVCAPGVAIMSSVPSTGQASWDGTSMAAPHVTGAIALILAHHPDFKGNYQARNSSRVDRVREIVRLTCTRIDVGDPSRTGWGIPNVVNALQPTAVSTSGNAPINWADLLRQMLGDRMPASTSAGNGANGNTTPTPVDQSQAVLTLLERLAQLQKGT